MDFLELYERHARDVYRFAVFLSGDTALAEDLTAETFVRALVVNDQLRVDTVKAYLLAITRNLYRDLRRRGTRLLPLDEHAEGIDPAPTPDVATGARLRLEKVVAAMQLLQDGEREALVLAVDSDMPYERVAAILGCSVSAVKVRVHRARKRLRSILEKERI